MVMQVGRITGTKALFYKYNSTNTDAEGNRCAKNLKNIYCSDGGADWSTPPVGNAADQWSTQWTPHTNIPVYDKDVATAETYTCQCMKGCTCTSEGATQKCFCAVPVSCMFAE